MSDIEDDVLSGRGLNAKLAIPYDAPYILEMVIQFRSGFPVLKQRLEQAPIAVALPIVSVSAAFIPGILFVITHFCDISDTRTLWRLPTIGSKKAA